MPEADALISTNEAAREATPYRVLARKYRPQNFDDLIGQEAMVRTLRNAFAQSRIHQAYIFTGVRGVGKTTTARILARALNYETASIHAPAIDMPELGTHCQAIMESRHVDVIEMDAASNTSIANIREIIESAAYKPISARTKVFIIDEVHMLSKAAFNGLLKTLEEPPPHVKFLFATTEIRKLPVTVLSRCQRFDLRRIESPAMIAYLDAIVAKEGVSVEAEAMALIARASEGSMRDALSLLDQAIAHGNGQVKADEVRASLGLADRARVIDLFDALMRGDIAKALTEFDTQHHEGAEAVAILTDLAEFVHVVTRLKLVPEAIKDAALTGIEKSRGADYAKSISIRALTMAWQILLKGVQEVQSAVRAKMAAEMVLVRLAYAADLPNPADVIRTIKSGAIENGAVNNSPPQGGGGGARAIGGSAPQMIVDRGGEMRQIHSEVTPHSTTALLPKDFDAVVALADSHRDIRLKVALEQDVRVLRFEPGRIEIALSEDRPQQDLPNRLAKALLDWTGQRWGISLAPSDFAQDAENRARFPTIKERADAQEAIEKSKADKQLAAYYDTPTMKAILHYFPTAKIEGVNSPTISPPPSTGEPEELEHNETYSDDDL